MLFKRHELIVLLTLGALLLIITTGALVKERFYTKDPRLPFLSDAAYELAEVPEKLGTWMSSIGKSPFEVHDRFPDQSGFVGQTNTDELYLLFSSYDGNINRSVVDLIDLRTFQKLHRWVPGHQTGTGGFLETKQSHRELRLFYADVMTKHSMHASLLPKGDLAVGRDDATVSKFDVCSHPIWQASISDALFINASLEPDDRGNTWVTAAQKIVPPEFRDTWSEEIVFPSRSSNNRRMYIDNIIVQISPLGEVIYSKSITDVFLANRLSHFLFGFSLSLSRDPMHLADIQPAITEGPHWQKGDLLISLKHLSMVLLYRPSTDKVLWYSVGHTNFQSNVEFVGDSKIIMFDNNTPTYLEANAKYLTQQDLLLNVVNGHNKLLVYDFATDQYSHQIGDALRTYEVKTAFRGRSQLLPTGDHFVEESEFGRLLYFSSDGSLLWSHVNRAEDSKAYTTGSSRILHHEHDIAMVRDFLAHKDQLLAKCK